tara:strand:+ start:493 stop:1026 length:534 start_codon:yes stop_codon:yes gene_type:complete
VKFRELLTILILVSLCGCSFQSNQLNYLKQRFESSKPSEPLPTWSLEWGGFSFELFAINYGRNIIFTNDQEILIIFDGERVSKVEGLSPNNYVFDVSAESSSYEYIEGDKALPSFKCSEWAEDTSEKKFYSKLLLQDCRLMKGNYINEIAKNDNNEIIALKYKFNPNYPYLRLQYKQ